MQDLEGPYKLIGTKQVLRAVNEGKLKKAYIAKDSDADIREKLIAACNKQGIPYEEILSMLDLGRACGIEVGAAVAGVLKTD